MLTQRSLIRLSALVLPLVLLNACTMSMSSIKFPQLQHHKHQRKVRFSSPLPPGKVSLRQKVGLGLAPLRHSNSPAERYFLSPLGALFAVRLNSLMPWGQRPFSVLNLPLGKS